MTDKEQFISTAEAASRLGVTHKTLLKRLRETDLPVHPSPVDRRKRLIDWYELQKRLGLPEVPTPSAEPPTTPGFGDGLSSDTTQAIDSELVYLAAESPYARGRMLATNAIEVLPATAMFGARMLRAEGPWAAADVGPFAIRDCFPRVSNASSMAYVTRRESSIGSIWDIAPGVRMADVSGSRPGVRQAMRRVYRALLAWIRLDPSEVQMVPCDTMAESVRAVCSGKVDLALASPLSRAVFEAELGSAGLRWLDLNPTASLADEQGARRHAAVLPMFTYRQNLEGVPSSLGCWGLCWVGDYSCRLVHAEADVNFVYHLVKWRIERIAAAATEQASSREATLESVRAVLPRVFIPLHDGAIQYFRGAGIWHASDDTRQAANVDLCNRHLQAWAHALELAREQGIQVAPDNHHFVKLWRHCRNVLPRLGPSPDEEAIGMVWH